MFKSLINLTVDAAKIVTAPVEIAADLARTITKPTADAAQEVVNAVKETTTDEDR